MTSFSARVFAIIPLLALVQTAWSQTAWSQTAWSQTASSQTGPLVVTSEAFIAECLCDAERVRKLRVEANDAQRDFDAARSRMDALKGEVDDARGKVDPDDELQLGAFRRLLAEQDKATDHLFDDVQPKSQATIRRYNREAAAYTAKCAGKSFDAVAMARLQTQLACLKSDTISAQPLP